MRNTVWLSVVITVGRVGVRAPRRGDPRARSSAGSGVFRTLFYLPALAPPVAAALAFVFLFNPGTGPVNQFLRCLGIHGPLWFNDPALAKPALTLLALWTLRRTIMVIFLAALLDVPGELYEAAALDGAERLAAVPVGSRCPRSRRCCCSRWSPRSSRRCSTSPRRSWPGRSLPAGDAGRRLQPALGYPDNSHADLPDVALQRGVPPVPHGLRLRDAMVLFIVSASFTVVLVRRLRSAGDRRGGMR